MGENIKKFITFILECIVKHRKILLGGLVTWKRLNLDDPRGEFVQG